MQNQKINNAIKILNQGGIVVYPTDTAYAIGCKFKDKKAIKKILQIKKRQSTKFTLIASSLYQVEKYFKLNICQKKLAKKYWPGPVSIVVSKKYSIRVPNNKIARTLAKRVGQPLIATSYNISGQPAVYDLKRVKCVGVDSDLSLRQKNVYILDVGPLAKRKASAVVQCFTKNKIKILRHGPFPIKLSA